MYHSFFIHSSVSGHLVCFHVLAIVIVLQWTMTCTFQLCFPQGIFPAVGLLGHIIVLFLVFFFFLRNLISILFSAMAVSVSILTNSARSFHFLHTLSSIYCLWIFYGGHSDWCEAIPHCNFDLHFSTNEQCWAFLMCLLAMYISSLKKVLFGSSSHFLTGLLLWYWAEWASCIFWRLIFCQLFHLLLYLPFWGLFFFSLCL